MANYKRCYCCGKSKETTQFSKRSASKDGLQDKCKACNKIDNLKFRTEINPEHHAEWQRSNLKRVNQLVKKYRAADKTGKIYLIQNPEGDCYIGMTQAHLNVRWTEHLIHYKQASKGKRGPLPYLHESFNKFGTEAHTIRTIYESDNINRKQLKWIETLFIKSFKHSGTSLNQKR